MVVLVVQHGSDERRTDVPAGLDVRQATRRPVAFRWTVLAAAATLWRLARRADVVVAGREIDLGLLLAYALRPLHRRPLAVTVQSRPDVALTEYVEEGRRKVTERALVSADLAVCVSRGLVPVLTDLGMDEHRVAAIPNGVDVQRVREAAHLPPEIAVPTGVFVVSSGRLTKQKGFDVLIRAHARALARGAREHTLLVLGDGPEQASLEQLARDLGVADSVVFAGFVHNPHAVVARALNTSSRPAVSALLSQRPVSAMPP